MDFKQYYHNRLDEEGNLMNDPLDVDAQQPQPQQQPVQGNTGILTPYVSSEKTLKLALRKLGEDIGKAITEYATKQVVQSSDFKSEDEYIKYCQLIRTQIDEKMNVALRETLTEIGKTIDNRIHDACPNK